MKDHRRIVFCLGASLLVIAQLPTAQSRPLSSADATELAAGKRIFDAQCAWCHGTDGSGGAGPSLQRPDLRHAGTDADLTSIVRNGISATEMPGFRWSLTDTMTWRTAAYVRSLGRRPAQPVRGDATRGAVIYEAKGCQTCHVIAGRGTALGPELTAIGALRGPAHLREAIVEPEAADPLGTLDGYLVAIGARSGTERWSVPVGDNASGHAITAAPLVVEDKVLVGISGGEAGIRGFLDAYDARTGRRIWRFWTIPARGEAGSDTWPGDSWQTGGGATWLTGSYDPALRLVYWGTGNPAPDWNGESRKGDNLYTCSLVALDIDSGRMRWHFQFTPHDVHDWDANQIPVLVDRMIDGRATQRVAMANRNGFFYLLDRRSGEFLLARQYAKQTWAEGIDPRGRPVVFPGMEPSEKGTLVYPSLQGATNWASPSFSPRTGLLYVAVREMGSMYFKGDVEYRPGTYYTGGSEKWLDDESWGSIRALHVDTGAAVWDFKLPTPPWGGVLSTAGGLVFAGSNEGNVFALDAKTGGRQHVAVAAGRAFIVFALPAS